MAVARSCVTQSHLVGFLLAAPPRRSRGVKRFERQRTLHSEQVAERRTVSLCLKCSNRAIYTSGGLWSGSFKSSIAVNDKNRPLGERYRSVYPVTAASSQTGSNHRLGPWSRGRKICKQSKSDPWDPSGSKDRVMYRGSNLRCVFHQSNTSQRGQDVVATPCTTTVIYTLRAQAETDVDDFKNGHLLGEDWVGIKFSCGTAPF